MARTSPASVWPSLRSEPCISLAPVSERMRRAFCGLTPAPGMMMRRPADCSANSLSKGKPCSAVGAWPEVSRRWQPREIICSSACNGSRQTSKARWKVMLSPSASSTRRRTVSLSMLPSGFKAPITTPFAPDGCRDAWNVEPWNKWFNVVDPFNKGVLTYRVIPGASFYDYYQNDEEYMCIEGLMALGIITYQDEMVGREWDELIGDWNEIWGNVYYNRDGKKLFYLDDESCIRIFDGVSSADNIYYEFKTEDYETMMYTTDRNVDLYKGAAIVFPESNVQTDIYFTATNSDGIDITYRVIDLGKKTCEVKADPNGYSGNAVATDVSEVKVPYLADGYVVTGIAADAFNSLSSLQNVTLPLSIRTIGANAFGYCENVVSVYMDCAVPPMLLDQDGFLTVENNYAFESVGVPAGTEIGGAMLYVPYGSEELYDVYPWNYWFSLGIATDPDGIENIKSLTPVLSKGEGAWYSLDGRKLGSKPTKAGLYINGGKKVVIK